MQCNLFCHAVPINLATQSFCNDSDRNQSSVIADNGCSIVNHRFIIHVDNATADLQLDYLALFSRAVIICRILLYECRINGNLTLRHCEGVFIIVYLRQLHVAVVFILYSHLIQLIATIRCCFDCYLLARFCLCRGNGNLAVLCLACANTVDRCGGIVGGRRGFLLNRQIKLCSSCHKVFVLCYRCCNSCCTGTNNSNCAIRCYSCNRFITTGIFNIFRPCNFC